ncbi:MAG TPA: YfhO family protein [Blastocatellia bacterium]|nr:YfhO family protein [Blastocatellia bacterium]
MKPRSSGPFSKILSRHTLSPRTANLITILFLILLPPVFFWRETLGWLTLGDQDALFWFLPIYKQVAEQIRAGHLPLWNPYMYSGMPLFAQPQAGVLDPINWIYLLGTTSRTLTLAQESSFAIALLAAYSYARRLGWKRRASVVTAVIYAFSGFAVARTIYPGLLHIFALTPLPLFFIERLYQCGKWRDVVFGSLIVAWQVFAGHPQPFLYSALLSGSYALFCAFFRQAENEVSNETDGQRFSRFRFLFRCAAMYLAGTGLSAVQLLPAAEFARQSVRSGWTYEMFTAHSLHPLSLLTVLFPCFHGNGRGIYHLPFWGNYWHHNEAQIYLGALALTLAATGLFCAWRARFRPGLFWGGVAAAAMLLALGKYVPLLARMIYQIPVLNGFRSPNRHWIEVTLATAVLAGYGVDYLLRRPESIEGKDKPSGITAAVCANIFAGLIALFSAGVGLFALEWREKAEAVVRKLPDLSHLPPGFLKEAGAEFYLPVILAVSAWLIVLAFTRRDRARCWYPLLLLVLLTDFNLYAVFAPISSPKRPELFTGQAIPAEISAENPELQRYHVLLTGPDADDFAPDWYYGYEMATGYDPLISARYKAFSGIDEAGHSYITSLVETKDRTLDLLSVRYVLVPKTLTANHPDPAARKIRAALDDPARWQQVPGITPRIDLKDYEVYRNLRSLPRAWMVERIDAAFEGDQLKIIRGELPDEKWNGFDPRRSALAEPEAAERLSAELQPDPAGTSENGQGKIISFARQNPHSIWIEVNAPRPTVLVLSEIVFPGWHAKIDNSRTGIYRLNYALQGIALQPGRHKIELIYRPDSLFIGASVSVANALLLLLLSLNGRQIRSIVEGRKGAGKGC